MHWHVILHSVMYHVISKNILYPFTAFQADMAVFLMQFNKHPCHNFVNDFAISFEVYNFGAVIDSQKCSYWVSYPIQPLKYLWSFLCLEPCDTLLHHCCASPFCTNCPTFHLKAGSRDSNSAKSMFVYARWTLCILHTVVVTHLLFERWHGVAYFDSV